MTDYAYAANKISKWLTQNGFKHHPRSSNIDGFVLYEHGICIEFKSPYESTDFVSMSVQTHPAISGSSFAETAILRNSKTLITPICLGYHEVLRHDEPQDLFDHIQKIAALIANRKVFDQVVACLV